MQVLQSIFNFSLCLHVHTSVVNAYVITNMPIRNYLVETFYRMHKPKDLYDSLLPLHTFTKCLGLCPYSYTKSDGKPKYVPSIIGSSYSVFIILLFVAYYIYQVEQSDSADTAETNKIAKSIDIFQIYGGIIIMTISTITNTLRQKLLVKAIHKIADVDHNLNMLIDHKSRRNTIYSHILFVLTMFASLEYMNCSMYLRQVGTLSTYCFVMCYLPMVLNAFVELQFITYIMIVKERFSLLNQQLLNTGRKKVKTSAKNAIYPVFKVPTFSSLKIVRNVRKLHALLCNAGLKINKVYSLQMLLSIGHIFINFTTLGYYCFDGAMKLYLQEEDSNTYNTITTGIWTLFKIFQLLLITLSCSTVRQEALLAGEVVFKMDNRFEPDVAQEINAFVKQIMHWDFKFTAFNFFNLDMELFYSTISASTTYLMILLQLDIANKQAEQTLRTIGNETAS